MDASDKAWPLNCPFDGIRNGEDGEDELRQGK